MAGLDHDEHAVARRWVSDVYQAVLLRIPKDLRSKFEGPELVHEVLAHRWFTSERTGSDVGLEAATDDYVATVLRHKPDEAAVLGPPVDHPDHPDDVDAAVR